MKFDFVAFLGGLTVGAASVALFSAMRSKNVLGQGVVTGGGPGGGFGGGFGGGSYAPGGGAGIYAGPPGGFGGGFMGPAVVDMAPSDGEDGTGPIVSVPPIIHGEGAFGGSFFGVNVAPWFWPLNVLPILQWPRRDEEIICKKIESGDGETLVCRRSYPVQPVAWGPPAGWL